MTNIESKVESLILDTITKLGYDLYDIEYVKEGKDYFLRIYIDKSQGISLEDCEIVSNSITEILDEADYIKDQYFLEVSSTGIEKVLKNDKHLKGNINSKIQINLFKPLNGKKKQIGILKDFDNLNIIIKSELDEIKIDRKNIAQIKTIYEW